MLLHKFVSSGGGKIVLTNDKTGANLPASGAPWRFLKSTDVEANGGPRIGASSADIISDIQSKGYCVRPETDDDDA